MNKKYVIALDQGTTSSRTIIFDHDARIVSISQQEFAQIYPNPAWVEHDPLEIWETQVATLNEALNKADIDSHEIAAIGVTNQRETVVIWDKQTGQPIYNAIVWQCRRTSEACSELKNLGLESYIQETTGLLIDPYFSASKIKWLLDNVPDARERAERGELLLGTIDTWLVWKLTEGKTHVTDPTNASRTLLFNIHTRQWDQKLLDIFDIPRSLLPEVKPSCSVFGSAAIPGIENPIPIAGIAGDQQSALFGQLCTNKGMVKNTYGTGCFLLMNTGTTAVHSKNGLLTTIAIGEEGELNYALEGSVFMGGATIQWLRDELGLIQRAQDTELIASQVEDTNGAYLVPAFVGLGAPYWDPDARGALVGLTRGTNRNHIIRAALEAIAYQSRDMLDTMSKDSDIEIEQIKVDGGAANNNFLMQFQADITNTIVERPRLTETTALGAAFLAGLAVDFWSSTSELKDKLDIDHTFKPLISSAQRKELYKGWVRAVSQVRSEKS